MTEKEDKVVRQLRILFVVQSKKNIEQIYIGGNIGIFLVAKLEVILLSFLIILVTYYCIGSNPEVPSVSLYPK